MAAETAMIFGHATGRVIVMPPETKWYLLDKNNHHEDDKSTFEKFFDLRKVRRFNKNCLTIENSNVAVHYKRYDN